MRGSFMPLMSTQISFRSASCFFFKVPEPARKLSFSCSSSNRTSRSETSMPNPPLAHWPRRLTKLRRGREASVRNQGLSSHTFNPMVPSASAKDTSRYGLLPLVIFCAHWAIWAKTSASTWPSAASLPNSMRLTCSMRAILPLFPPSVKKTPEDYDNKKRKPLIFPIRPARQRQHGCLPPPACLQNADNAL